MTSNLLGCRLIELDLFSLYFESTEVKFGSLLTFLDIQLFADNSTSLPDLDISHISMYYSVAKTTVDWKACSFWKTKKVNEWTVSWKMRYYISEKRVKEATLLINYLQLSIKKNLIITDICAN